VLPKPDGAMHDWEIYREIALRTQKRLGAKAPLKKRIVQRVRLSTSPTRLITLLLRRGGSGVTMKKLRVHPAGVDLGPLRAGQLPERMPRDRVDAAPELVVADLERLREAPVPAADELLLIGRRHQRDCNSWMHNSVRLTKGKPRHQLLMHPDDLASRGLDDGATVSVSSRVGDVQVEVQATDDMMRGVVSLPHGYGHRREGVRLEQAVDLPGVSINDLTDAGLLDVSGNAAFNGVPVRVSALH
jgi:anaerobic selenocysteine-containing dehydrogenase